MHTDMRMYVCAYICRHTTTHRTSCFLKPLYICLRKRTYTYTYLYIQRHGLSACITVCKKHADTMYQHVHRCTELYMYTYTHMHVCIHQHTYTCTHYDVHAHMYVYRYIQVHYVYTYVYTQNYVCIPYAYIYTYERDNPGVCTSSLLCLHLSLNSCFIATIAAASDDQWKTPMITQRWWTQGDMGVPQNQGPKSRPQTIGLFFSGPPRKGPLKL